MIGGMRGMNLDSRMGTGDTKVDIRDGMMMGAIPLDIEAEEEEGDVEEEEEGIEGMTIGTERVDLPIMWIPHEDHALLFLVNQTDILGPHLQPLLIVLLGILPPISVEVL